MNQWILLTVTHALEAWNIWKRLSYKLRAMQRAHKRIMQNIAWRGKKLAQWIRKQTRVRDILEGISRGKKWIWVGHVARMQRP